MRRSGKSGEAKYRVGLRRDRRRCSRWCRDVYYPRTEERMLREGMRIRRRRSVKQVECDIEVIFELASIFLAFGFGTVIEFRFGELGFGGWCGARTFGRRDWDGFGGWWERDGRHVVGG
jgi:hypothetical protein